MGWPDNTSIHGAARMRIDYETSVARGSRAMPLFTEAKMLETISDKAVRLTRAWIRNAIGADCPSDYQLCLAVRHIMSEWMEQRSKGCDVLSSAALDEMVDMIEALRELR